MSLISPKFKLAPNGFDPWRDAVRVIQAYEIWQVYGRFVEEKHPRFGPGVAERMQAAARITKAEVEAARKVHAAAHDHIRAQIPPGTVMAMPSAPCIAQCRPARSVFCVVKRFRCSIRFPIAPAPSRP